MSLWKILGRTMRLRCPRCGEGKLFSGWVRMPRECEACGLKFEREPGYFLGSIYFNYGVTAFIVTVAALVLLMFTEVSERTLLMSLGAFCVLFPMWFFRYARALWMAWDHFADPLPTSAATSSASTPPATEHARRSTPG
ncbi:MAG TPA: DUF983 domain-containing protein [Pirellulales bacterium]|nr:DUF983 domain-containing protein [Pirellulales bacterium]